MSATVFGPDGKPRCRWCASAPEFFIYHDTEWGFPVEGHQETRLEVRRTHDRICIHAGHGTDQRSRRGLRDQSQGRALACGVSATRTLKSRFGQCGKIGVPHMACALAASQVLKLS